MIEFKDTKIVLMDVEPGLNPRAEELAAIILYRVGLMPRKEGSTEKMHRVLLELYERSKEAYRRKKPEAAIITVEEMGAFAGISRQTMYDYLRRWTDLNIIMKTSYISEGKVIIGYKLNGSTLENAFEKSIMAIQNNLTTTQRLIKELQRIVKNDKISESQKSKDIEDGPDMLDSEQKALSEA